MVDYTNQSFNHHCNRGKMQDQLLEEIIVLHGKKTKKIIQIE